MNKNETLIKFGQAVRYYRRQIGMSQKELAARVGYTSHVMISQIEKGRTDIPVGRINDLARALGVTPKELLVGEMRSDFRANIISALDSMSAQQLEDVWRYIDKIIFQN